MTEKDIPIYCINDIKDSGGEGNYSLHRFEYFDNNIGHLRELHRHDHFALFLISAGKGNHVIDFESFELKPNRLFFISPGQVHAWGELEDVSGFILLFSNDFFTAALQYIELRDYLFYNTLEKQSYLDLNEEESKYFIGLFKRIEDEQNNPANYSLNIIRSLLNIILFQLTRIYEQTFPIEKSTESVDYRVSEFEKLVREHYKTKKAVSEYAELLFITPNYLNAICKKTKGKVAGELIRDRIMIEAKRLLAHSDLTVAEIAFELNFEDNSYFGRFFKKYDGKTPAHFRKEVRKFTELHPLHPLPDFLYIEPTPEDQQPTP
ncbi:MAG: helix-turn-helix domain-containing protein [Bacteroidetes bacterium]|nr:helix-turn-helix domain-containing protein [Bacteroidota bacterium]